VKAKIISGVTASKGGPDSPPYIHFPVEITSGYSAEVVVTFLPPLASAIFTVAPNNPVYLGQLTFLGVRPLKLEKPEVTGHFDLKFEMDDAKIWKIENARKNADVCLQIRMEGLAFIEEKGRTAYRIDSWSAEVGGMEARYNYIRIPVGDWLSFVEDWGYGKLLFLDIPIEFEVTGLEEQGLANRLKEAARGMQQVKDSERQGEWIALVRACRPILDLLRSEKEITEGITVKEAIRKLIKDSGLPHRYAEGIEQVINGLVTFVQPTHHIIEGKEIRIEPPYDKEDAIFVEATVSTLLNMLIRKLTKRQ
jgi:hypothetical protein